MFVILSFFLRNIEFILRRRRYDPSFLSMNNFEPGSTEKKSDLSRQLSIHSSAIIRIFPFFTQPEIFDRAEIEFAASSWKLYWPYRILLVGIFENYRRWKNVYKSIVENQLFRVLTKRLSHYTPGSQKFNN